MKAQCEKCGGWYDLDWCELHREEPDRDIYIHSWQVAVDHFRYCGPIIVEADDDQLPAR